MYPTTDDAAADTAGGAASADPAPSADPSAAPTTDDAAADTVDEFAEACKAGHPKVALVGKYEDRVPVQIKSAGHLEQLRGTHGAGNVEVQ